MKQVTPSSKLFHLFAIVALVVATNVFSSCVTLRPSLTKPVVIAIADRVAINHGYSLSKFKKRAEYNFVYKDDTWTVFYDLRPDARGMLPTGGDFTVYVNDDTGKTRLIPGR